MTAITADAMSSKSVLECAAAVTANFDNVVSER
jgi:hypothetical protein